MRLRGDFQYLFVVLCLSAAAAAEPIPKTFQDATSPPPALGNDVALPSQTGADGGDQAAASGDLPTDSAFFGGESSSDLMSAKPGGEGTLVAVGLPVTETDFGPPIPLDPTKEPSDFGAYPGYPQPADIPNLYDPKTRQKNGYMDYYEQTRGECQDGEELYCCRWGQREVFSTQKITAGPIKCVIWLDWLPVWRFPQCIPDQQQCCAGGVDEFGNGIDCKKANKASHKKQRQGAAAHDGEAPPNDKPPPGNNEREKAPASQRVPVAPGAQQFENVDPSSPPPPTRIPEPSSSSSSGPWNLLKLWPLAPLFQAPEWLHIGTGGMKS